ncbi:carbohydrate kinase family protein [bacterium]|nr:carbohydrate kinase family protein [bacterium]
MTDVVTIGSATIDVFVRCDDANIVSVQSTNKKSEFMSYKYGSKLEITDFDTNVGGGGVNTAVNFANLGFNTSAIFKMGEDIYSKGILKYFENKNVNLSYMIQTPKTTTGFSIILVSFEGDRTVLAHRGGNGEIKKEDINFEAIKNAKFIYVAPLNGKSTKVLEPLVDFAHNNGVKVCVNAGTSSIKRGFEYMKKILEDADVVVMNKEEAQMCTKIEIRPDTAEHKFSQEQIHPDLVEIIKKLKVKDYQIVVVTDGGNGSYAYDGEKIYYCPVYPGKVVSTLGAGDAFASTFCASMNRTKMDIGKSLLYGSINSGSVVSKFSATEGLLTFEQIEERLRELPEYSYKIINVK